MNAPASATPATQAAKHNPNPHDTQVVFDEKGIETPFNLPMQIPEPGNWRNPGHIIPVGWVLVSAQGREALLAQGHRRAARETQLVNELAEANLKLVAAQRENEELKAASRRAVRLTFEGSSCVRDPIAVTDWEYVRERDFDLVVRTYKLDGNQLLTPCRLPTKKDVSIGIGDMGEDGYVVVIRRGERIRPRVKEPEVGYYVLVMSADTDLEFREEFYTVNEFEEALMSSGGFLTPQVVPGQHIRLRGYQAVDPIMLVQLFERVVKENFANGFRLRAEAKKQLDSGEEGTASAQPAAPVQGDNKLKANDLKRDDKNVETAPMKAVPKVAAAPGATTTVPPIPDEARRRSDRPAGTETPNSNDNKAAVGPPPHPQGNGGIGKEPPCLDELATTP